MQRSNNEKMTAETFNGRLERERAQLWDNGFCIHKYRVRKSDVHVFSLYDFFVEVHYDIRGGTITNIKALVKENDYHDLLKTISIKGFFTP